MKNSYLAGHICGLEFYFSPCADGTREYSARDSKGNLVMGPEKHPTGLFAAMLKTLCLLPT